MPDHQITRTTNRLPFIDLDSRRFEDLTHALVEKTESPITLQHLGRSGGDDGIDILGIKVDPNGNEKRWVIQCKRYKAFAYADAEAVIDEALKSGKKIDVLLVVVGCDISKKARDAASEYATSKGISDIRFWDATNLESILLNKCPTALDHFFGVNYQEQLVRSSQGGKTPREPQIELHFQEQVSPAGFNYDREGYFAPSSREIVTNDYGTRYVIVRCQLIAANVGLSPGQDIVIRSSFYDSQCELLPDEGDRTPDPRSYEMVEAHPGPYTSLLIPRSTLPIVRLERSGHPSAGGRAMIIQAPLIPGSCTFLMGNLQFTIPEEYFGTFEVTFKITGSNLLSLSTQTIKIGPLII